MKSSKRTLTTYLALAIIFTLSLFTLTLTACGSDTSAAQGTNNPNGETFTIEAIQENTANYVGTITLIGIVGSSGTQDFALENESETFEVLVDYRGSQALPQLGDKIIAEGTLRENRPCCGPGFTLTTTRFEAVND